MLFLIMQGRAREKKVSQIITNYDDDHVNDGYGDRVQFSKDF